MITSAAEGLPHHASQFSCSRRLAQLGCRAIWLRGRRAQPAADDAGRSARYRRHLVRCHGGQRRSVTLASAACGRLPMWGRRWSVLGGCRIVLPADFEHRYDGTERALILAHEAAACPTPRWLLVPAGAVRGGLVSGSIHWRGGHLAALRHDQELACDAAVLREHGAQRRSYANAMLKTQSAAFALPVGCTWSPRHPLTERIAMLKLPLPSRLRSPCRKRCAGLVSATVVGRFRLCRKRSAGSACRPRPAGITTNTSWR